MDTAWVRRFDGPANKSDIITRMVVDGWGNATVTGHSDGGDETSDDYLTIKYTTDGEQYWQQRYNAHGNAVDWATGLAQDHQHNLIVTGYSGFSPSYYYLTIKYRPDGSEVWRQRFDPGTSTGCYATAVAVDASDNIIVTGSCSDPAGLNADWITVKYDSSGNLLWTARFAGPANDEDAPTCLTVDDRANIYVAGYVRVLHDPPPDADFAVVKYNARGEEQWAKIWNNRNADDKIAAIKVDAQGNVYVTGSSWTGRNMSDHPNYQTFKYDSMGNQGWGDNYDGGSGADYPADLAVDRFGNCYVTGSSFSSGTVNYATIKYTPSGTRERVIIYDGAGHSADQATALAIDTAGRIYVTGGALNAQGNMDIVTFCYNPDGSVLWWAQFDGTDGNDDIGAAIGLDDGLNVYVAGKTFGQATKYDYIVLKYACGTSAVAEQRRALGLLNLQ
ncbi:MAG: SBBP repeat-containing protein, partial [candidate division WOR-3 bacterium]